MGMQAESTKEKFHLNPQPAGFGVMTPTFRAY